MADQIGQQMQRTRVVHCRREPFHVYIGRPMNRYPADRYPELLAIGWGANSA